jgi:TonB-like protein
MRALPQVIGSLFALLFVAALPAYPQGQSDYLRHYVDQPFLIRDHGGLHEVVKINKQDADAYQGVCDKAVQVQAAKLTKRAVQFDVADIGLVMAPYGTPRGCTHADETRITKIVISGFSGQETQDETQMVISRVLQTPEAYLDSHPSIIPVVDNSHLGPAPKQILQVTPWYPPGIRGPVEVDLQITIGVEGKAQNVQIEKGAGSGLDVAILRVLPLWRYEPASKNGQAVPSSTFFKLTYNMGQGSQR